MRAVTLFLNNSSRLECNQRRFSHSCFLELLTCLILLFLTIQYTGQSASLVALWELNGTWDCANDTNYNLIPSGPLNLTNMDCLGSADFHGGLNTNINSAALAYAESTATPTSFSFNPGLSIMGLFYVRGSNDVTVVAHDSSASTLDRLGFQAAFSSQGAAVIQLRDTFDRRLIVTTDSNTIPNGTWKHVAWVWDGSLDGGIQVFVDGVERTTVTSMIGSFSGLNGVGLPVRIGASEGDSIQNVNTLDGMIRHVSLWLGALSPQEVLTDFENTGVSSLSAFPAVRLELHVTPGVNYHLQVSTNLISWEDFQSSFRSEKCTNNVYVDSTASRQFFRLRLVQ